MNIVIRTERIRRAVRKLGENSYSPAYYACCSWSERESVSLAKIIHTRKYYNDRNRHMTCLLIIIIIILPMLLIKSHTVLDIGGYLSSSLAIATDASHLLTDFASFMISLCAIWVASRPATQSMPFGWYRAEVLGALTSVLLIWVVTGVLLYLAVERLTDMTYTIDADIMLITSAVGLCVNLV